MPARYRNSRPFAIAILLLLLASELALSAPPEEELVSQALEAARDCQGTKAIALLSDAINLQPRFAAAYYARGRERFRAGQIRESVADFDKYVELRPEAESRQWERGIALYYADEFARGAKQFELYQTFHNQDVENSTWRYLCMARSVGVERAREAMLPIENDPRVPMMEIYELYRGRKTPADVLAAARAGNPSDEVLAGRLFYAHLYLGLYYEANGELEQAKKYVLLAADEKLSRSPRINTYMWDVARVHAELMRQKEKAGVKGLEK